MKVFQYFVKNKLFLFFENKEKKVKRIRKLKEYGLVKVGF